MKTATTSQEALRLEPVKIKDLEVGTLFHYKEYVAGEFQGITAAKIIQNNRMGIWSARPNHNPHCQWERNDTVYIYTEGKNYSDEK